MINFCMCGASKAIGLSIFTFSVGVVLGSFCPLQVLAVVELAVLLLLGYLCLFKW